MVPIKIDHRESRDSQRLNVSQLQCHAELFDRRAEIARSEQHGADQGVSPGRARIEADGSRRMVECAAQVSLLEQRKAQTQMGVFVALIPCQQLAKELLRRLVVALSQGTRGAAASPVIGSRRPRSR